MGARRVKLRVVVVDAQALEAVFLQHLEQLAASAADVDHGARGAGSFARGDEVGAIDQQPLADLLARAAIALLEQVVEALQQALHAGAGVFGDCRTAGSAKPRALRQCQPPLELGEGLLPRAALELHALLDLADFGGQLLAGKRDCIICGENVLLEGSLRRRQVPRKHVLQLRLMA